jgi:hypothetical protein
VLYMHILVGFSGELEHEFNTDVWMEIFPSLDVMLWPLKVGQHSLCTRSPLNTYHTCDRAGYPEIFVMWWTKK